MTVDSVRRAFVVGWPISHSRSPLIHRYWLEYYQIDGDYCRVAKSPQQIGDFLTSLRAGGENGEFVGGNVTVPHKQIALEIADERDRAAEAIGAANTLYFEGRRLCATNTDAAGFMAHLADSVPDWQGRDGAKLVLGAGGAARAIVYGLLNAGISDIWLCNRTRDRADALAAHFDNRITVIDWAERHSKLRDVGLLINTTSLGMVGSDLLELKVSGMAAGGIVADIVYAPLNTELLLSARKYGLDTVDGLGMLLHQAVAGFELWFKHRPQVTDALRKLVLDDLTGAG